MKLALFSFFLLGISTVLAEPRVDPIGVISRLEGIPEIIDGIIKNLLQSARAVIPEKIVIDQMNTSFPYGNVVSGDYAISEFLETGLKEFVVTSCQTNILSSTLSVILTIPSININGNYFQDMLFGSIVPMYGQGPFNVHLKNLQFNLTAKYSLNIFKLKLQLKNTSFVTTLEDATFDIHGLLNNEAFSILVSQVMDDTVDVFINKHTKLISEILSPVLETAINKALAGNKVSLSEVNNLHEQLNQDDIKELGQIFMTNLMRHPKFAKGLNV